MHTLLSPLRIATLALACAAATACGGTSQNQIDGGKTFLLGGEQRSAVFVEGRNVGAVPVEILKELKGQRTPLITVAPGQTFEAVFEAGEIAMLRNTSASEQAVVKVTFNRDVSQLSMRYIDTNK